MLTGIACPLDLRLVSVVYQREPDSCGGNEAVTDHEGWRTI